MTDLSVTGTVTRTQLSMQNLSINDHTNYVIAGPAILGGNISWDRKQVNAPWVDGDITVSRRRANTTETLSVYVAGATQDALMTNIRTLVQAFTQDRYTLQIVIGSSSNSWDCEAADYSVQLDTPHVFNKYVVVTFTIPRKPVALAGGY